MMGKRAVAQDALFYEFSLERHVPLDHLPRSIDRFVDLTEIREHLRPFYSEMGRPSIDPGLMIRSSTASDASMNAAQNLRKMAKLIPMPMQAMAA